MTSEHKQLVRESWAQVASNADAAATLFYNRLFELDPELQQLLVKTDQNNLFVQTLSFAVNGLSTPQQLLPAVEQLGKRSLRYGLKESHYKTVGVALLWTLEKTLCKAFTTEVLEAWTETYSLLSTVMRIGARGRYEPLLR